MKGKNCSLCVYRDAVRLDGTIKCCTPERQRDKMITDCCILEAPLRILQAPTKTVDTFIAATNAYIAQEKNKSSYWRKQLKHFTE